MAAIAGTGTGAGPAAAPLLSAAEVKLGGRHLGKGQILPSLLPAPSRAAVRGARHCGRGGGGDGGRGGDGRPVPAPHGRPAAVGSAAGLDGRRPPRVGTGAGEAEGREPVGVGRAVARCPGGGRAPLRGLGGRQAARLPWLPTPGLGVAERLTSSGRG